jgi:ferredoxin
MINLSECVGCGACSSVCPSDAFRLDGFNPTEFFFEFASDEESLISCRKNVPCISALNVEHIIGLSALKGGVVFDMGYCNECAIAHTCRLQIEKMAEEANYLLEAMDADAPVSLENRAYVSEEITPAPESSRRDFFQSINLKNAIRGRSSFEREVEISTDELTEHALQKDHIAQIRQKSLTDRRKLLYGALKRIDRPPLYHVVEASEVSFTSEKLLDAGSCTACQMCYRVCPTGALSSDARNSKIDFDPFMCIKCNACHDACEPDAITLSPSYSVKEFFEPAVKRLVSFDVKSCDECGALFSSLGGEKLCRRCMIEEEEARELWGLSNG